MSDFTITFNGLIMHYDRGASGKSAVLVHDEPDHVPELIISKTARDSESGWTGTLVGNNYVYPLKGRTVTIDDIATGAVTAEATFTKHVPSLQAILTAADTPIDDVANKKIKDKAIVAFVDYSGGKIAVDECFETEIVFDPAITGDPRCIGRLITFTGSTTTGTKITIRDGLGGSLVVEDGTEIRIRNSSAGGTLHHKEYKRLLKLAKEPRDMIPTVRNCATCTPRVSAFVRIDPRRLEQILEVVPELQKPFDSYRRDIKGIFFVPRRSVSIECSNTQWP